MTVRPSATDATAAMMGTRSGISFALISNPASLSGRDMAALVDLPILAPNLDSAASTLRSPWAELSVMPSTLIGRRPIAPAQSQKAAFDQSPSTSTSPGVR